MYDFQRNGNLNEIVPVVQVDASYFFACSLFYKYMLMVLTNRTFPLELET